MKKRNKKNVKDKQNMKSGFDPLGSYTGNYLLGKNEDPVQDVDDL